MAGIFPTICAYCGELFQARSSLAAYCGGNCRGRACYYRKQGRPIPPQGKTAAQVAGYTKPIRPAVVQPEIISVDDLPAGWRDPAPAPGLDRRFWQGTAITRREADGFVNATAMCQANGREWFTYARSERSRQYIAALAAHLKGSPQNCGDAAWGSPQDPTGLIRSITSGPNEHRGTWIHPRLAIDLARWISPAFAVWMDGWFLESLARPQHQPLPHGVHVVASNPRQAAWLWAMAVETEVGQALMGHTILGRDRRRHQPDHYQLHLLPA